MVTSSIYINIMSITHHEVENTKIRSDNASLHDWIVVEVSQTILEELSDIVG